MEIVLLQSNLIQFFENCPCSHTISLFLLLCSVYLIKLSLHIDIVVALLPIDPRRKMITWFFFLLFASIQKNTETERQSGESNPTKKSRMIFLSFSQFMVDCQCRCARVWRHQSNQTIQLTLTQFAMMLYFIYYRLFDIATQKHSPLYALVVVPVQLHINWNSLLMLRSVNLAKPTLNMSYSREQATSSEKASIEYIQWFETICYSFWFAITQRRKCIECIDMTRRWEVCWEKFEGKNFYESKMNTHTLTFNVMNSPLFLIHAWHFTIK